MAEILVMPLDPGLPLPSRSHEDDAGLDLVAAVDLRLKPFARAAVSTGVAIALPEGHAGLVVPRSGLAVRHGLTVLNAPGLIDPGYRGEVKVVLVNLDARAGAEIRRGQRIAQLVVVPIAHTYVVPVHHLPTGTRGNAGFGSTET